MELEVQLFSPAEVSDPNLATFDFFFTVPGQLRGNLLTSLDIKKLNESTVSLKLPGNGETVQVQVYVAELSSERSSFHNSQMIKDKTMRPDFYEVHPSFNLKKLQDVRYMKFYVFIYTF